VQVTVPQNTTISAGKFYLLGGFLGAAMRSVTTGAGETAELVLNIEQAEYETDQILTTDAMAGGADIYWDAANNRFTQAAAGNRYAGRVTLAKDANNAIRFKLADQLGALRQAAAQANSTAGDVATIVGDFNALLAKLRTAGIIAS
jgi:predicted RecA/RadA family phage recombinase